MRLSRLVIIARIERLKRSLGVVLLPLSFAGIRTVRKQLVVGVVVQLMMQLSGIDAVFYYSTDVRPASLAQLHPQSSHRPG